MVHVDGSARYYERKNIYLYTVVHIHLRYARAHVLVVIKLEKILKKVKKFIN